MSQKVSLELTEQQATQLVKQLSLPMKIQLVRRLEQETWPQRLRQLMARVDQRVRRHPDLFERAMKVVGPARRAAHARRHRH